MAPENQNPEQTARDNIDRQLARAGWTVQNKNQINLSVGRGVAVREYQTDAGPADYVLFADGQACGVIEAKREEQGHKLTPVEEQSAGYAAAKLKWVSNDYPLPFVYESTGLVTRFTDYRDPAPRSREVFNFQRPETFARRLVRENSLRARFERLPTLPDIGLRDCQTIAIHKLETSFRNNRPRALVQMATGAGKTFTAITFIYRLLKYVDAGRILFLVDTRNLGKQAEQEFMNYVPADDNRKFTELYNVQRLTSSFVDPHSQVCIGTIQRMYSILKGEPLEDGAEETNPAEVRTLSREPIPVGYNERVPPEFFDFIVIDECHRSIYNLWRQVLEYFDSFLIGLTATPDARTYGFFNQNVVSEYTHEQAVTDGVNVQGRVYRINTKIGDEGGQIKARQLVQKRDKLTRARRWQEQDADEAFLPTQLDRSVVSPSQIRTVIRAFRQALPAIFPGRDEVPKTLIFAKTDSHADDIIQTVREEFDAGNQFCKKVTYRIEEDPDSVLASFRNDYNPRIAVTVDMIATGTDVKALECLLFMRDVKSKNYFEQMKGRGTRTLDADELKKRSPTAHGAKAEYILIDAVGVTESVKTDSHPLDSKPTVALKDLMFGAMMGAGRDDEAITTLAGRLARVARGLTGNQHEQIAQATGGQDLNHVARGLIDAIDADAVEEQTRGEHELRPDEHITPDQYEQTRNARVQQAVSVFTGEVIELIDGIRRENEQTIDHDTLDEVIHSGWSAATAEQNHTIAREFAEYLQTNRDRIAALSLFYAQPYRRKALTYAMIRELLDQLKAERPALAPARVWRAYAQLDKLQDKAAPEKELAALVALVRRTAGIDGRLTAFDKTVNKNFRDWILKRHRGAGQKFDDDQMRWLRLIRDYIAHSFHLERDDLDYDPFDRYGGLAGMYRLFGDEMDGLIEEMNEVLAA